MKLSTSGLLGGQTGAEWVGEDSTEVGRRSLSPININGRLVCTTRRGLVLNFKDSSLEGQREGGKESIGQSHTTNSSRMVWAVLIPTKNPTQLMNSQSPNL